MPNQPISPFDRWFLVAWLLFTTLLIFHRWNVWFERSYGDSAFLAESIVNIHDHGRATTLAGQTAVKIVYGGFISASASEVPTLNTEDVDGNWSVLTSHAYLILFLLAPLNAIFSVPLLLSIALALSFSAALLAAYIVLRRENVSGGWAALFCAVVASHPFWRVPLWTGQDYVDRYYVGLCSLLMLSLIGLEETCKKSRWAGMIALYGLCCLVSERMALIAGGILLYSSLFAFWGQRRKSALLMGIIGLIGVGYAALVMRFVLTVHSYGSFLSLQSIAAPLFLTDAAFRGKTILFLAFNLPLLLLALRRPKWGLLALGIILPNIFGNIGGAEKTGWFTHYHSLYIPTLVVAAALGFSRLRSVAKGCSLALMAVIFVCLDPYSFTKFKLNTEAFADRVPVLWPWKIVKNSTDNTYLTLQKRQTAYEEAIPPGSIVSTPEFGMGRLIFGRKVFMFPLGIRQADVILMSGSRAQPGVYTGAASFLSGAEKEEVHQAIMKLASDVGFDLSNPQEIVPGVYAFRRKPPPS